jgi:hypothetical protein
MSSPASWGGILLVVAAIVWLIIFVPGYTQRSQLSATTQMLRREAKAFKKSLPVTPQERLGRLINTQRAFSVFFLLGLIGSVATWFLLTPTGNWAPTIGLAVFALASLAVSQAAAGQATAIARGLHQSRQEVRKSAARAARKNLGWTPNPLPEPLSKAPEKPKEAGAQIIDISVSRRVITSKEIDEIMARRRAI